MQDTCTIFHIPFFSGSKSELIDRTIHNQFKKNNTNSAKSSSLITICTPNPEQVVLAQSSPDFLVALRAADICIPDGIGVVVASRVLALCGKGTALPERIAGVDLMLEMIELLPTRAALVIGGVSGGQRALQVGGKEVVWLEGYKDISHPTQEEERVVRRAITAQRPQAFFLAFAAPHQELWMMHHRAFLEQQGVRVALVVGGAVDMLSGKAVRAPAIIRTAGLEWLYRLIQQPWRWRRQLRLLTFVKIVCKELLS